MMKRNFYEIHIGNYINTKLKEEKIDRERICNFFDCNETDIDNMLNAEDLPTNLVLKWSKLLKYDFFRLYSQHLILYSTPKKIDLVNSSNNTTSELPEFRKNIYTIEIIKYILEQINSNKMTITEVISEYNIPKTTLYKWIKKHK